MQPVVNVQLFSRTKKPINPYQLFLPLLHHAPARSNYYHRFGGSRVVLGGYGNPTDQGGCLDGSLFVLDSEGLPDMMLLKVAVTRFRVSEFDLCHRGALVLLHAHALIYLGSV